MRSRYNRLDAGIELEQLLSRSHHATQLGPRADAELLAVGMYLSMIKPYESCNK
jgi:hypothetical protein